MNPNSSAFAVPRIAVVTLLTLALISTACRRASVTPLPSAKQNPPASPAANSEGYTIVTVSQLVGMLPTKNFTMINVHTPYEGEIPQTDFNIPFDRVEENLDKLPDKDAPILIYCRSGRMSMEATLALTRLGYSHVMHLEGGFNAWKAAGKAFVMGDTIGQVPPIETAPITAVVESFYRALLDGNRIAALALLAPDAIILESGSAETREEYQHHHLAEDIAFSRAVPATRSTITVHIEGITAWMASATVARGTFNGQEVNSAGTELMVLTKSSAGWSIRAIHWSSRKIKGNR